MKGDACIPENLFFRKPNRHEAKKKYDIALEKLDYKIGRYEIAQKTGVLTWDDSEED